MSFENRFTAYPLMIIDILLNRLKVIELYGIEFHAEKIVNSGVLDG
mgnify:CR=1 FL=1